MLANLRALLAVVIDIIRFKGGPENLPASTALLGCVVATFAAGTALAESQVATAEQQAWPAVLLVGIVVTLAWYQIALRKAKKGERYVQAMTGLFAARAVFVPVVLPMAAVIGADLTATQTTSPLLAIGTVILTIWLLAIEVRIIRATFEWPTAGALGMVLAQKFSGALIFGIMLALTTNPG